MDSARVSVGDNEMHYLTAGDGPPVVLLHGGIIDSASVSWGDLVDPLAEDYTVYAPDLLGYGDSDWPDVAYSNAFHLATVTDFLDALNLEETALVGSSMGGGVAIGLALEHPDRVSHLVPVDSYGLGRDLPNGRLTYVLSKIPATNKVSLGLLRRSRKLTRASLGNVVEDVESVPPHVVDEIYGLLQRDGVGRAYRRWRKVEVTADGFRTVYLDDLQSLAMPTLYIHGRADDVFPADWARRAADRSPDSSLAIFDDCAHWPPREQPDRFLASLREFLPA